jgi:hypothetical protein
MEGLIRLNFLHYLTINYELHCLTAVNNVLRFQWLHYFHGYCGWTLGVGHIVAQVCVQLSHESGVVTMVNNINYSWPQADWRKI